MRLLFLAIIAVFFLFFPAVSLGTFEYDLTASDYENIFRETFSNKKERVVDMDPTILSHIEFESKVGVLRADF